MNAGRKYAEDLVGSLDRSQYNKQRDVAQSSYNTNWEDISNQYKNLQNKLKSQQEQANNDFAKGLTNVADVSYDRMRSADNNLVNRGLNTSGLGDLVKQADTQSKGAEVLKLLSSAGNVAKQTAEQLKSANETVANKENALNNDLSNTLGNIGAKETQAQSEYNSGLASIAGQKDTRDMENALAAAQRAAQAEANRVSKSGNDGIDEKMEQYYKNKAITNILAGINPDTGEAVDWDDSQKSAALKVLFDIKNADSVVKIYNDNSKLTETNDKKQKEFDKQLKQYEQEYGKLDVQTENLLKDIIRNNGNYNPFLNTTAPNGAAIYSNPMTKQNEDEQVQSIMAALSKVENGEIPSSLLSVMSYPNMAKEGDIKSIIDKYQNNINNNPLAQFKDYQGNSITNGSPYNRQQFDNMNREIMPIVKDKTDYENIMALNELKNKMDSRGWNALVDQYNNYQKAYDTYSNYKSKGPGEVSYKDLEFLLYGDN